MSDTMQPPSTPDEAVEADLNDDEWDHEQKRKYRKAKRKWHNREPEVAELNLTAMMDMLTILLVYLLKSFNTNPAAELNQGVAPPESTSRLELKESMAISVSLEQIMVENKQVVGLVNGELREEDTQGQGTARTITPLYDALDAQVTIAQQRAEAGMGPEFEGKALIIADRKVPYRLLSSVLYTAGQAKLAQFQFVIMKP